MEGVDEMDFIKLAKEKTNEYLKDLESLVSIESTRDLSTKTDNAPFGENCRKALDTMLGLGQRDGFQTKDIDGYAGVIEYGQQTETLGILGHLDIVPVGEDWTKDPLTVTVDDGYVFGRGVVDDKGPALAAYYALKIIKEQNIPLKRRVMLITGCDEESGMECMDYYKKHAEIPNIGFVPDADFPVIYGEKGGLHVVLRSTDKTAIRSMHAGSRPNIVIGKADCTMDTITEKQKQEFAYYCKSHGLTGSIEDTTFHIDGVFAHAATPWLGENAALHLLNFVGSSYDDTLAQDLYKILKDWQGKPLGIYKQGLYMGFLTMNTGIIDIEDNETKILIDIRYPNDMNAQEIMEQFDLHCKTLNSHVVPQMESDSVPLFVDPQSNLVKELMRVYQKYTNDTFSCAYTLGGGTYARKFENFVSFGPEFPNDEKTTDQFVGSCHQRDEGIKLESLILSIAIYAEAIVSLCS